MNEIGRDPPKEKSDEDDDEDEDENQGSQTTQRV